jgi:hypothetical protein
LTREARIDAQLMPMIWRKKVMMLGSERSGGSETPTEPMAENSQSRRPLSRWVPALSKNCWKPAASLMGGLWRIEDLFHDLGELGDPSCTSTTVYLVYRKAYCESLDMDSNGDSVCDSLFSRRHVRGSSGTARQCAQLSPVRLQPRRKPRYLRL